MMKKKLIFLDIDGTLTPAGSNNPPESAMKAVRKAQANGHLVFLCTGRNPGMLAPVLALGFEGAVACAGGHVFAGDRVLFDCPMEKEQFETGMRLLKENGVFRTIEARNATWGDEDLGDFLAQAGEGNSELVRWRKALAEQLNIRPMQEYVQGNEAAGACTPGPGKGLQLCRSGCCRAPVSQRRADQPQI